MNNTYELTFVAQSPETETFSGSAIINTTNTLELIKKNVIHLLETNGQIELRLGKIENINDLTYLIYFIKNHSMNTLWIGSNESKPGKLYNIDNICSKFANYEQIVFDPRLEKLNWKEIYTNANIYIEQQEECLIKFAGKLY